MAISLASLVRTGTEKKPARVLVHGVQGVGKTSFGAAGDKPVFIRCEDGTGKLDVDAFPVTRSFGDVMEAITALYQEEHGFRTVVIDSVDWLEPLIWAQACAENGWPNIEAPGYGKGYKAAMDVWRRYVEGIDALRDHKGMWVVQIAHTDVRRHEPPDTEAYDRYVIKLRDAAAALLLEHSDVVLFANYLVSVTETKENYGGKRRLGVGGGQRVVYSTERPAYIAKNRYGLADQLLVPGSDWAPLWDSLHAAVGV